MKFFRKRLLLTFVFLSLISCAQQKINGASIVSPPKQVAENCYTSLKQINATWAAIIPYAFTPQGTPKVQFDSSYQWWGETSKGAIKLIQCAKKEGLKVLLKPHVWYHRKWIGDFVLTKEEDWRKWENDYTTYILNYAKIAQEQKVELFCIGTELKKVVIHRPEFFNRLIPKIKKIYKGKLTYAANWNSVKEVQFWQQLDYIGVDAYYPLSEKKQPTVEELNAAWKPIKKELKDYSVRFNKPVLFTEYGFESCYYNTKTTWGSDGKYAVSEKAQTIAYQSFFESFYSENWFAGGFFWKWHVTPKTIRNKERAFTPQGKDALSVIRANFGK